MQIVTTETEPGRKCAALSGPEVQFPVMVLPTSGIFGVTTIANGAIRGMKTCGMQPWDDRSTAYANAEGRRGRSCGIPGEKRRCGCFGTGFQWRGKLSK